MDVAPNVVPVAIALDLLNPIVQTRNISILMGPWSDRMQF